MHEIVEEKIEKWPENELTISDKSPARMKTKMNLRSPKKKEENI